MNKSYFFFFLFFSAHIIAQNTLTGIVIDSKTDETLIGANIVLVNTSNSITTGAASDYNGEFMGAGSFTVLAVLPTDSPL